MSSLKIDFDALPLEGFEEGRNHVQRAFDADFKVMSEYEQAQVRALLTKKSFNKGETEQVQKMFTKYIDYIQPFSDEDQMERAPVDYAKLDQMTKAKIHSEKVNAEKAVQESKAAILMQQAVEEERAGKLAEMITEFSQNEAGETLANVHTSQGFQDVYDYRGSYIQRFKLERRKEQISSNFSAKTHLFQKLYYTKDLLLDDERKLRNAFNGAKSSYEATLMGAQAALFLAYWPLTYKLSLHVKPVTIAIWTAGYYFGVYKNGVCPLTTSRFQSVLNSAA